MKLNTVFTINAIILLINGLMALFNTQMFFEMANLEPNAGTITIGQFMGTTFVFLAILSWRTQQVAGSAINAMGQLWALGGLLWAAIIGFHVVTGAAGGPTALVNLGVTSVLAVLFFISSRK